jgi:hypothetical protein
LILAFIVRLYWLHLTYTQSYDACVQNFGSTEIAPGVHRCKVPFLNREFFSMRVQSKYGPCLRAVADQPAL